MANYGTDSILQEEDIGTLISKGEASKHIHDQLEYEEMYGVDENNTNNLEFWKSIEESDFGSSKYDDQKLTLRDNNQTIKEHRQEGLRNDIYSGALVMFKLLFYLFIAYLIFRYIIRPILRAMVIRTAGKVMEEMQNRQRSGQMNHDYANPHTPSKKTNKEDPGEYISYEEVK